MNKVASLIHPALSRCTFNNVGLQLSYLDNLQPSDDIPVVMLHGFTASAQANWVDSGWIAALTERGRRVIALDARGHGHSDKPYDSDYYPSNVMMEDSIALLSQLGFPQADFVGYSMGARMSAFAAIKYPHRVRKLFLGGMGIHLMTGVGSPEPVAEALLAPDLTAVKNRNARRFRRLAERGGNDLTALAHCILSSRQKITAEDLSGIIPDTLIVVGQGDDIGGSPEQLAPYINGSRALEIVGCNHFDALLYPPFINVGVDFVAPKLI